MPTLQLIRSSLAPQHAGATRDYLLSIMLWPVECDLRLEFQRTCNAIRRKEAAVAAPGMPVDHQLYDELVDVLPPRVLSKEMWPYMERGYRVGTFYALVCAERGWEHPGAPVSLTALRSKITAPAIRKLHPGMDVGEKLLERDLHDLRPVATYWTAFFLDTGFKLGLFGAEEKLADFFGVNEWVYRVLTEAPSKKGAPVLPRDLDLWRPPAWLKLPQWGVIPTL